MGEAEDRILAERLNSQPVIFRGYTDSELVAALALSGAVCFPAGILFGLAIGSIPFGIGLALMGVLGLVVLGAGWFQAWKRGRPEFWLQQRFRLLLAEAGLSATPLLRHRGVLRLGRDGYDDPARRRRRPRGRP
jgi:conjugative transfer region protein (TIGR03750 family)